MYDTSSSIRVKYEGLPGNKTDWITVVPVGTPELWWGEWHYTDGNADGFMTFEGLEEGDYEVRMYYDWPCGCFGLKLKSTFSVVAAKPSENLANVEVPEYRDRRKRHPFAAASPPINTLASSLDPKTAGFGPSTDLWPNGARSIVGYFELMCP